MRTRWLSVALILGGVSLAAPAWAQPLAEPVPFSPSTAGVVPAPAYAPPPSGPPPMARPPTVPAPGIGGIPTKDLPAGPGPDLVLPANLPGAFMRKPPPTEKGFFFHAGAIGLVRQQLGDSPVALIDTNNTTTQDTGAVPRFARFVTPVQSLGDVDPTMGWGFLLTAGWIIDDHAFELTGFYIGPHTASTETSLPGRLYLYFANPPTGFAGDNGLWQQADYVRTELESSLGNLEWNYRWWNRGAGSFETLLGVRYVDSMERLTIFTDDDGLTRRNFITAQRDPTLQADYSVRAQNRILAPQVGFEWHWELHKKFQVGTHAKGAWGVNFVDVEDSVRRGDGLERSAHRHRAVTRFGHLYEAGMHFDFYFLQRARLRAGYTMLLLAGVTEAADQVQFDLGRPTLPANDSGSIFYHGPQLELQFLF